LAPNKRFSVIYSQREDDSKKLFRMLPDIKIISDEENNPLIIIDTKYKITEENAREGVSQNDMYQMFAYSKKSLCSHVILLYPRLNDQNEKENCFNYCTSAFYNQAS